MSLNLQTLLNPNSHVHEVGHQFKNNFRTTLNDLDTMQCNTVISLLNRV